MYVIVRHFVDLVDVVVVIDVDVVGIPSFITRQTGTHVRKVVHEPTSPQRNLFKPFCFLLVGAPTEYT